MAWLGRSLGEFGAQAGQGYDIAQQWKQRDMQMKLAQAKASLEQLLGPLQLQELQERIRQMRTPKTEFFGTPGGGTSSISVSPEGNVSPPVERIPGRKGLKERLEDETDPKKRQDLLSQLVQESEALAGTKLKPTERLQKEAQDAFNAGDIPTYQAKLKELSELAAAGKPNQSQSKISLIMRANAGDKEAAQALESLRKMDIDEAMAKGEGWGRGRAAFQFQPYVDENGQLVAWNGLEAMRRQQSGQTLVPASRISPKDVIAFQQFQSEAAPALQIVRANAKAFDNPQDRAIYAEILAHAGPQTDENAVSWLRNVVGQALRSKLSPEGRQEAMGLARLNETVGRMRSILGLPATDSAMSLTLSLVPGPATPDSKYVIGYDDPITKQHIPGQIDMLQAMSELAVGIPAMRNAVPQGGNTPPPGAKVITLDEFLKP